MARSTRTALTLAAFLAALLAAAVLPSLARAASSADVRITITDDVDPVEAGGRVNYQIRVENLGPNAANNVFVQFGTPSGTTFSSLGVASTTKCTSVPSIGGTGTIQCGIPTLVSGDSAFLNFAVAVNATANDPAGSQTVNLTGVQIVQSATNDPVPGNNTDSETTAIVEPPDASANLAFTVQNATPSPVEAGGKLDYLLKVDNPAGGDAANNTFIQFGTPAGTKFSSLGVASDVVCTSVPAIGGTGTIQCGIPTIAAGDLRFVNFSVTVDPAANDPAGTQNVSLSGATIVQSATPDPSAANNSASSTTPIVEPPDASADAAITVQSASPSPVEAGGKLDYLIKVDTAAGGDAANNVYVQIPTPSGTTFSSFNAAADVVCTGIPSIGGTGTIQCGIPTIAAGDLRFLNYSVTVDATANDPPGTQNVSLTGVSIVQSGTPDPAAGNNTASNSTPISEPPDASADLKITITDDVDPVELGALVNYQIKLENLGPDASNNFFVQFGTPLNTTLSSFGKSSDVVCTSVPSIGGTGTAQCGIPTLTVGDQRFLNFTVAVGALAPSPLTFTAQIVQHTTPDPGPSANSDTEQTVVNGSTTAVGLQSASASPVRGGIAVRWQAAAEIGVVGYRVYRQVGGRLELVGPAVVRARGSVVAAGYRVVDRNAPRGVLLRYRIQAVLVGGKRVWLGSARTRR
jgi:uncharacterized repeat protein (TIGR01451 family)